MRCIRYADLPAFVARVEPFLLEREAEHCLAIGILTTLMRGETFSQQAPYLWLCEDDDGGVIEVALATPPFNLILSHHAPVPERILEAALHGLIADILDPSIAPPGVIGPDDVVNRFAELWSDLMSERMQMATHERIYRLERVIQPQGVAGYMRRIEERDRPLLREWLTAFSAEALGIANDPRVDIQIDRRLRFESSGLYLWETQAGPVSCAGYGGPTPHGIRVGPVYTPPEARGHGYASALVAALSQLLLDEGRDFVFLFTDLANPTSNHIYQQIGYEPVSDVSEYTFERPA